MAKKDFTQRDNPVMRYISTPETKEPPPTPPKDAPAPQAAKGAERKTRRLNLIMQPSVLEDLAKVAAMRRTSVNDLMNTLARECVARERERIDQYNALLGQEE